MCVKRNFTSRIYTKWPHPKWLLFPKLSMLMRHGQYTRGSFSMAVLRFYDWQCKTRPAHDTRMGWRKQRESKIYSSHTIKPSNTTPRHTQRRKAFGRPTTKWEISINDLTWICSHSHASSSPNVADADANKSNGNFAHTHGGNKQQHS